MPHFSASSASSGTPIQCQPLRKPNQMEASQIKQQIADLTERADALRGYL
jgi:hypothetical protein